MRKGTRFLRQSLKWGVALSGWLLAAVAHSACTYASDNQYGSRPLVMTAPLSISNLTIGRDVPNGTLLYTQVVTPQGARLANCPANSIWTDERILPVTPRALSSWNTGTYAGKVYQTDVPGIGVVIWRDFGTPRDVYPMTFSRTLGCPGGAATCTQTINPSITNVSVSLIKIGPVSPGTITGTSLPTAQYQILNEGVRTVLSTINFSGSINIVSQTCTTPNVSVPLGEHQTSAFNGRGSGTDFRTFSIQLRNCPAFHGASASLNRTDGATGWTELNRIINPNVIRFSLEPTTAIVTGTDMIGVVRVSPTTSGPPAAGGVGIQIAHTIGEVMRFNTLLSSGITPANIAGANYTIRLRARYIQIGTTPPTPGPANTSVMFTINYQ